MSSNTVENEQDMSKEFEVLGKSVNSNLVQFRKLFKGLKKNEMQRVALAIIESPLEATQQLTTAKEQQIFQLGYAIKQDMVMMTLEYLKTEQAKKLAEGEQNGSEE